MSRLATKLAVFFTIACTARVGAQNALTLDGSNDYAVRAAVTTVTDNLTMEAWVKWDGVTTGSNEFLFYNGNTSFNGYGLFLNAGNSYQLSILLGGNDVLNSTRSLTPNVWQHVAVSRSSTGEWSLYIDGRNTGDSWYFASPYAPTDSTTVGSNQAGGEVFGGQVDEFRIWKIARTPGQILAGALSAVSVSDTNLVGYWRFDEAAGTTAADSTPNARNLALINGPTFTASSAMQLLSASNLQATADTGRVRLTWSPGAGSAVKYCIYMDTLADYSTQALTDSTTGGILDTTKTVTSLNNFRTYYFRVAAVSATGQLSGYSNDAFAVPTVFFLTQDGLPGLTEGATVYGDYDNDGDLDILMVGYFDGGDARATIFRNDGGTFVDVNPGFESGAFRASAAFGDYNNDGLLDVAYTGSLGNGQRLFKLYRNNGAGSFTDMDVDIPGYAKSSLAWVDFDNDGDLDISVMGERDGSNPSTNLYRNDGSGEFNQVDAGLIGLNTGNLSWSDYDKDGDLDLLALGTYYSGYSGSGGRTVVLYRNDGGSFTDIGFGFPGAWNGMAAWGDMNNDGYPDIVYTGGGSSSQREFRIYQNDGDGSNFTEIPTGLPGFTKAQVSLGDFDNDGDLDVLITGEEGGQTSIARTYVYRNDGAGAYTQLSTGMEDISGDWRANMYGGWADVDRDGDLDVLLNGRTNNSDIVTLLYDNRQSVLNSAPTEPTGLIAVSAADSVYLRWNSASDAQTPKNSLTYNVRMGRTAGGTEVMPPLSKVTGPALGGGFRLVVGNGNVSQDTSYILSDLSDGSYFWSVQAIDAIYRGSKFQSEPAPFVIDRAPTQVLNLFTASRNNGAFVRWSAKNKSDVVKYYIQTDTAGSFDSFRARVDSTTGGINDTTITLSALTNSLLYYVRVWAVDGNGWSGPVSDLGTFIPSATPGKWFVTNTLASGFGSLDSALQNANNSTQTDTIVFQIGAGSTISVTSLTSINTDETYINGDLDGNGTPDITIDGIDVNNFQYGLIVASNRNTVKGLVVQNWYHGIHMTGNDNLIVGNYIGTDETGNVAVPNGTGIHLYGAIQGNRIGDGTAAGRNIISGNLYDGIHIDGGEGGDIAVLKESGSAVESQTLAPQGTFILGNWVGIAANGDSVGNGYSGVYIEYTSRTHWIGDGTAGGRNVISGNPNYGVYFYRAHSSRVLGNYIGTNAAGTSSIRNGSGVYFSYLSSRNTIGDGTAGGRNIISGNANYGIGFGGGGSVHDNSILGNYIGTDVTGNTALGNGSDGIYFDGNYHYNNWIGNGLAGGGNVISGNGGHGIYMYYSSGNRILGNWIGTNAAGNADLGNRYIGVFLNESDDVLIGNGTALGRNVISGNDSIGIYLSYSDDDSILGNYIGVNSSGTASLPNDAGIYIQNSQNCAIGGNLAGQGNVISGNTTYGIAIVGDGGEGCEYECGQARKEEALQRTQAAFGAFQPPLPSGGSVLHFVRGNLIGTNAAGTAALGNGEDGIWLITSSVVVGDTVPGGRNVISGNGRHGIYVDALSYDNSIVGNYIGTDLNGSAAIPNAGNGVMVWNASDNAIGVMLEYDEGGQVSKAFELGTSTQAAESVSLPLGISGNVISGNGGAGIELCADTGMVWYTYVQNNYIGVGANGTAALGNGGDGLKLENISAEDSVEFTWIENNTIAFNSGHGVHFDGSKTRDNQMFVNSIHSNGGSGIQMTAGAQRGVWAPLIQSYDGSVVSGKAAPGALVQIFGDLDDEGREYKDSARADGSGNWAANVLVMFGYNVTAIQDSANNSSAFSNAVMAPPGVLSAVPTSLGFAGIKIADSTTQTIRLSAASGGVILSGITMSLGTHFSVSATTPDTLLTGDSLILTITFKPTATGSLTDTLVVANTSVGGTVKVALSGTGVENTPPTLTAGVFALSVVNKYLSLYVYSSEPLSTKSAVWTFNGTVDPNPPVLADVPGLSNASVAQYKLTTSGTLSIDISASDTVNNAASLNKTYSVSALTRELPLNIRLDGFEATAARGVVNEDGFILVGRMEEESDISRTTLGKSAAIWSDRMAPVGRGYEWVSSVGLRKDVTIRITYSDQDLVGIHKQFPDFDERNIGLYREQDGQWIYEGGEGADGMVTARIVTGGNLMLLYNADHEALPKKLELSQNYPNPFNPTTTIRFGLPDEGRIRLVVYNILGQKVTEIFSGLRQAGFHTVLWNGRNDLGQQVASGVYIYRLETPQGVASRKMLLVK